MSGTLNPFVVEVQATVGGERVLQCYQCGTCSGSCPVINEMDYGPRRLMHLIQLGHKKEVLTSGDMWYCVSCYSCANRCPRDIPITALMADLRHMALHQGYAHDREAELGQAFVETVNANGRMFEPELMMRYYLRTWDIAGLIGMIPLGIQMLLKGKIPFIAERIKSPQDLDPLCAAPPDSKRAPMSQLSRTLLTLGGGGLVLMGALAGLWFRLNGNKK